MRFCLGAILILAAISLVGCGSQASTLTSTGQVYTSQVLSTSYPDALSVTDQLSLGTLRLEGTEQAVTPEQASALLPLWQALQADVPEAEAEQNAVYAQIEATMTQAQLAAIAAMQLTRADLTQGMPEPGGPSSQLSDEQRATMRATAQAGGQASWAGGPPSQLSDEQRAAMRATIQAGGRPTWAGGPPQLSDEQRAAMRATAQAGGRPTWAGGPRRNGRMLDALIGLLTRRARSQANPDQAGTPTPPGQDSSSIISSPAP